MTKRKVEVTIPEEHLISALGNLGRAGVVALEEFLAAQPNAGVARAAEYFRWQEQVLCILRQALMQDQMLANLQEILTTSEPCPCGREGSVLVGGVYRGLDSDGG